MKTKNIFRMLLVAAALLLGANNMKAQNQLWPTSGTGSATGGTNIASRDAFANANPGDALQVYVSPIWNIQFCNAGNTPVKMSNSGDDGKITSETVSVTNGYIECGFTDTGLGVINDQWNGGFRLIQNPQNLNITGVTLVDENGVETSLSSGTTNYQLDIDKSKMSSVTSSYTVRIYVTHIWTLTFKTNSYGTVTLQNSNSSGEISSSTASITDGYVNCILSEASLSSSAIMSEYNGGLTIIPDKLTMTKVILVSNGSTPTTKTDIELSYSLQEATATIGEAWTVPTLSNPSHVAVTYSSTNQSVATIDDNGNVTLVGAGETWIKANFAGDNNYNAKEASYKLTVSATQQGGGEEPSVNYIMVDMGSYEYRTYVTTTNIDFSQSVGIKAYYATGLNSEGTGVIFRRVTGIVPASVALLLQKVSGASEYKLLTTETEGSAPTPNKLVPGNDGNVGGSNIYVLTVHNNQLVFAETNINTARVDRVHAYLDLHNTNARRRLAISFDDDSENTTGIDTIEIKEQGIIYNLRGQRVQKPTKGVYIINGKKMIIK